MASCEADQNGLREHSLAMWRLQERAKGVVGGPGAPTVSSLFQMPADGPSRLPGAGESAYLSPVRNNIIGESELIAHDRMRDACIDSDGNVRRPPRSPLSPLSDAQRETLRTILVEAGIISGDGSRVPGFGKTG